MRSSPSPLVLARLAFAALLAAGSILAAGCQGADEAGGEDGQVGDVSAAATTSTWQQLDASGDFTCGLANSSKICCWGQNSSGQLGDGTTANRSTPGAIGVAGVTWTAISTGRRHVCALDSAGQAWCWGHNGFGELGNGTTVDSTTPQVVPGFTGVAQISAGGDTTCAVKADGTLWCWGQNTHHQIEPTALADTTKPMQIDADTDWASVEVGDGHYCGRKTSGTVFCRGYNVYGEIGTGSSSPVNVTSSSQVSGLANIVALSSTTYSTCAIRNTGALRCWGANNAGQLGIGSTVDQPTPQRPQTPGTSVQRMTMGNAHGCAVVANAPYCWGANANGELGTGQTGAPQTTPVRVKSLGAVSQLAAGGAHTCAIVSDGTARCWGLNWAGELGNGTTTSSATPVVVQPCP